VGIIAGLRPEKAHDVFLGAARVLAHETNAHFVIVGGGTERDKLKTLASTLNLSDRVHFLGLRTDIARILRGLDVVVLSSRPEVETFPVAIMEAMAASKPVVCTKVGSLEELVLDGQTGFLVAPNSTSQLAARIKWLLDNPGLAKKMGRAGRARILKRFTVNAMVRATEHLLVQIADKSARIDDWASV
jgi:glycosyltransferase involved in cell wall biosynthesis